MIRSLHRERADGGLVASPDTISCDGISRRGETSKALLANAVPHEHARGPVWPFERNRARLSIFGIHEPMVVVCAFVRANQNRIAILGLMLRESALAWLANSIHLAQCSMNEVHP